MSPRASVDGNEPSKGEVSEGQGPEQTAQEGHKVISFNRHSTQEERAQSPYARDLPYADVITELEAAPQHQRPLLVTLVHDLYLKLEAGRARQASLVPSQEEDAS